MLAGTQLHHSNLNQTESTTGIDNCDGSGHSTHQGPGIGARLHETVVETRSISSLRDKHIKGGYSISTALVFVIVSYHFLMQFPDATETLSAQVRHGLFSAILINALSPNRLC